MTKREKTRAGAQWTEARYFGFIRSALRRAFTRYPVGHAVKTAARRQYTGVNKRQKWEYQCADCATWAAGKETQVDHINPAGTLKTFADLPGFVERLFCEKDNLQVLCLTCHRRRTDEQKQATRAAAGSKI